MVNYVARLPLADCHFQGVEHQLSAEVVGHGPAHDLAAPGVEHDCQIQEPGRRRYERDVGYPELVRSRC